MIRNYLVVALRNIRKHSFYSLINIFGLAAGITACLYIFLYVSDELSYDSFHHDAENLYRIGLHGKISGQEIYTANSCLPLGHTMKEEIPGVEDYARLVRANQVTFRNDDIAFTENRVFYSDSNFYSFFNFPLIKGDPKTVLREPNSIVITPALAKKYFGEEDPVGKVITFGNNRIACKVTGISSEAPSNSHFHFDAIISFSTVEKSFFQGWTGNSMFTYFRKTPATSVEEINKKLEDIVEKYVGKEVEQGLGMTFEEFRKKGGIYSYVAYPITDSRLYSVFQDDIEPSSDIRYVYIFTAVGFFILLIACINFMNLSTARSAGRAKEVGLRKTLGSHREQMIFQFLAESFTYTLMAMVIAIAVCYLALPQFNLLAGKQLTFEGLMNSKFIVAIAALTLFVGVVAGSYPAFYLTSFEAVEVLKGKVRAGMKSKGVRSSLVVVQFAVSTFLIISTVVVYNQLQYMQEKNLGIDKNNVITISNTRRLGNQADAFKNSVGEISGVQSVSFTNNIFPGVDNITVFRIPGSEQDRLMGLYYTDHDQQAVMKFTLKEGRFFSRDFPADSTACVINESAVRELGLTQALDSELIDFQGEQPERIKIIGIIHDFNYETLKNHVRPLVIRLAKTTRNLMVRYQGNPAQVIGSIEAIWKQQAPGEPLEYTFLDQDFDKLFREEQRLSKLFTVLTGLAIVIACLGLFALASFTAEQRTKEIGIRKAMGATEWNITTLLSKEFSVLVIIAIVVAGLPAYFLLNNWLEQFAYRQELSLLVFVVSGMGALLIAWLTVLYQAWKAALAKPVNSLRYE
jgi:putative ABC transport system permease protein